MSEEFKDILRIESEDVIDGVLYNRQLGFEKPNRQNRNNTIKMKYKSVEGEILSFTPDTGDANFRTVNISSPVVSAKHAATKEYVDSKITDIKNTEKLLNGFVDPSKINVSFDYNSHIAVITPVSGAEPIEYYVFNTRYTFSSTLSISIPGNMVGQIFVFLKENGLLSLSAEWLDGYLPILVIYRTGTDLQNIDQYFTVTKDYHGTSMSNSSKEYVNMHTGTWLKSEYNEDIVLSNSINRPSLTIINEDVSHILDRRDRISPSICYKKSTDGFGISFCSKNTFIGQSWLSYLSSQNGTYYQLSEDGLYDLRRGVGGYGTWYIHYVRPDARGANFTDVLIPLDKSIAFNTRHEGLEKSIKNMVEEYLNFVCDWKALSLFFIQDGSMLDFVNISFLDLHELRFGFFIEKILKSELIKPDMISGDPSFNGFENPSMINVSSTIDYVNSTTIITVEPINHEPQVYYVNNKKKILSQPLSVVKSNYYGLYFLFIDDNGQLVISNNWITGYLSIMVGYEEVHSEGLGQFMMIKDYHGISMSGRTKYYINMHTGCWLDSGCEVTLIQNYSLSRSSGVIVNDDVAHNIENRSTVLPVIGYYELGDGGKFKSYEPHSGWLSILTSNNGTRYQGSSGLVRGNQGLGTWFLYIVRPDVRGGDWNDLVIPLDRSLPYEKRYQNIDKSIKTISKEYGYFIFDMKVLGVMFLCDGVIREYISLASLDTKDLIHGGFIEKMFAVNNTFIGLFDTFSNYEGKDGFLLKVNGSQSGVDTVSSLRVDRNSDNIGVVEVRDATISGRERNGLNRYEIEVRSEGDSNNAGKQIERGDTFIHAYREENTGGKLHIETDYGQDNTIWYHGSGSNLKWRWRVAHTDSSQNISERYSDCMVFDGNEKKLIIPGGANSADSEDQVITRKTLVNYLASNGGQNGGTSKISYGFSSKSWNSGCLFGPNGSNDIHGNCSHVIFETGSVFKLSYYFETHNGSGSIVVSKNGIAVYSSPEIPYGSDIYGLINNLNIPVIAGDRIKIIVNGAGARGQVTLLVRE